MKKAGPIILLGITLVFAVFLCGFFIGRNANHHKVDVHVPAQSSAPAVTENTYTQQPLQTDPDLININIASAAILDTLPGIGPVLAQRIVDYREAHGPFADISELANVDGIGQETLTDILELITVGG